jgi:succinate dehydrogenase/fumarate reductase cytochrome b subunit
LKIPLSSSMGVIFLRPYNKNMINKKIISVSLILLFIFTLNLPNLFVFASNYQLLEPSVIINNEGDKTTTPEGYNLARYLATAYIVMFVVVIAATILFFVIGGLQYILSDLPMVKASGMKQLQNALLGLGLAISSYLLLQLINPDLVKFNTTFSV